MNATKATERWWVDDEDETGCIFIASGSGDTYHTLAEVISADADVDAEVNATLIVQAVNNHDALVDALETLISENCKCCEQYDGEAGCMDGCDVITAARAALEAAKGE